MKLHLEIKNIRGLAKFLYDHNSINLTRALLEVTILLKQIRYNDTNWNTSHLSKIWSIVMVNTHALSQGTTTLIFTLLPRHYMKVQMYEHFFGQEFLFYVTSHFHMIVLTSANKIPTWVAHTWVAHTLNCLPGDIFVQEISLTSPW